MIGNPINQKKKKKKKKSRFTTTLNNKQQQQENIRKEAVPRKTGISKTAS
jgi:hypothetical protein